MKKLICLLLLPMLYFCLSGTVAEEEGTKEIRCDEWRFSVKVPAGLNTYPVSVEDWYGETAVAGGLVISKGGPEDIPWVGIVRRSRFYNVSEYLGSSFELYLEEYGETPYTMNDDFPDCGVYRIGGKTLYGSREAVYEDGEELFRECRLIPVSDNRGMEFIVRYTAETEAEAFDLLDAAVRSCRPDEEAEKAAADFLPEGHSDEPDLQNGEYLLRVEDTDKIETDGYFTAVLYKTDYYTPDAVHAMQPGDTILTMDRVLTITGIEPNEAEDGSWYEADLFTVDNSLTEEHFNFILEMTADGDAYRPYFGGDNYAASRVGEVRIQTAQNGPIEYCGEEEDGTYQISADLLDGMEDDPALFGMGWNEYTHRGCFKDGRLTRIVTWSYPHSPEDMIASW